ncbi:flagellar hook-length control protein FliK [Sphingomonas oleivorans]|nr:flagellar hook-length control protein FliK [Sphingomonas oleivorans]
MESTPAAQTPSPDMAMPRARIGAPMRDTAPLPATQPDPTTPDLITVAPDTPAAIPPQPIPAAPMSPIISDTPNRSDTGLTTDPRPAPADLVLQSQLDLAHDGAWLDGLARDIVHAAARETELRFHLNPEHLGTLKIELQNGADGTAVRLTADTEAARQILADAQPRLIAEARAQGVRISEAHVDLGQQQPGGQQPQFGGQHPQQQHRTREDWQPFNHIRRQAAEAVSESSSDTAERYA